MEILKKIAEENPNTEDTVLTSFTSFGDFSLGILFIYYIRSGADVLDTQTEINLEILKQFSEAKLEMAFPTQTLHTIRHAA